MSVAACAHNPSTGEVETGKSLDPQLQKPNLHDKLQEKKLS